MNHLSQWEECSLQVTGLRDPGLFFLTREVDASRVSIHCRSTDRTALLQTERQGGGSEPFTAEGALEALGSLIVLSLHCYAL